jgi:leucyl-tRNA synthetase
VRSRVTVPFGTERQELEKAAVSDDKMQPFLQGKQIVKIIVVPDRLVNVVIKG